MHLSKTIRFILLFSILSFGSVNAQNKSQAYLTYIKTYYKLAQIQQREYGIPASITLAQGLLESGAGQSTFAKNSNNHFGIKCHDWTGDKIYQDDDEKGECFRKYNNVLDSYEDHSKFLKAKPRYSSLFTLSPTDYNNWAYGLKKAGYATDPAYAYKLISIIENYELHKFDLENEKISKKDILAAEKGIDKKRKGIFGGSMGSIDAESGHEVFKNNGVRFVVAQAGDTYGSIADEFNMSEKRIYSFNEINQYSTLTPGTQVYIQRKKTKAARGYNTHVVKNGESMYTIAQTYAIRIEKLYDLNKLPYSQGAQVGQVLKIR